MSNIFLIITSSLIWGVLHSLTASHAAKAFARKVLGDRHADGLYRLLYNVVSVVTFLPLMAVAAILPDQPLYRFPDQLIPFTILIQVVCVIAVLLAVIQVDLWSFMGLRQLLRWLENANTPDSPARLIRSGMFALMRHPIYFFSLVALWLTPVMSLNTFTLFVCFTIYFWVGSIFEERKLVAEFGEDYKQIQQKVPRIVPFTKWWKR
jgi:protein-S-isoprenylcysteine O-methyltransferase Ste14